MGRFGHTSLAASPAPHVPRLTNTPERARKRNQPQPRNLLNCLRQALGAGKPTHRLRRGQNQSRTWSGVGRGLVLTPQGWQLELINREQVFPGSTSLSETHKAKLERPSLLPPRAEAPRAQKPVWRLPEPLALQLAPCLQDQQVPSRCKAVRRCRKPLPERSLRVLGTPPAAPACSVSLQQGSDWEKPPERTAAFRAHAPPRPSCKPAGQRRARVRTALLSHDSSSAERGAEGKSTTPNPNPGLQTPVTLGGESCLSPPWSALGLSPVPTAARREGRRSQDFLARRYLGRVWGRGYTGGTQQG